MSSSALQSSAIVESDSITLRMLNAGVQRKGQVEEDMFAKPYVGSSAKPFRPFGGKPIIGTAEGLLMKLNDSLQEQLIAFFRDRGIDNVPLSVQEWCTGGGRLSQQLLDPLLDWVATIDQKGKGKSSTAVQQSTVFSAPAGKDELSVDSLVPEEKERQTQDEDDDDDDGVFVSYVGTPRQEVGRKDSPSSGTFMDQRQQPPPLLANPLQELNHAAGLEDAEKMDEKEEEEAPLPFVRRSQSTTDEGSGTTSGTSSIHLTPIVTALLKTVEMLANALQQMNNCVKIMSEERAAFSSDSVGEEKTTRTTGERKSINSELRAAERKRSAVVGIISRTSGAHNVVSVAPPPKYQQDSHSSNVKWEADTKEKENSSQLSDQLTVSFVEASLVGVKALKQSKSFHVVSIESLNSRKITGPAVDVGPRDLSTQADQSMTQGASGRGHRLFDSDLEITLGIRSVDQFGSPPRDPSGSGETGGGGAGNLGGTNPLAGSAANTFTLGGRQQTIGLMKNYSNLTALTDDNHRGSPALPISQFQGTVVVDDSGSAVLCQFEIMAELGRGNFGKVSLVMDADGELFALKTLRERKNVILPGSHPRSKGIKGIAPYAGSTRSLGGASAQNSTSTADCSMSTPDVPMLTATANLVEREIAVMKRLNHPNVVKLHAVIEDPEEGETHLVMQYVDNGPIGKVAPDNSCRPLPFTLALKYMAQVARGLEYLHSQNIIHRDIKPENILIGSDDTAYLSDFGVSSIVADGDGPAGVMGTMSFFSPELLAAHSALEQYGKESDVWAFGVTLYCLLFGKLPFTGRTGPALMRAILMDELVIPDSFPDVERIPETTSVPFLQNDISLFLQRHADAASCAFTEEKKRVPKELKLILLGLLDRNPTTRLSLRSFRRAPVVRRPDRFLAHHSIGKGVAEPLNGLGGQEKNRLPVTAVALSSLEGITAAVPKQPSVFSESTDSFDPSKGDFHRVVDEVTEEEAANAVIQCNVVLRRSTKDLHGRGLFVPHPPATFAPAVSAGTLSAPQSNSALPRWLPVNPSRSDAPEIIGNSDAAFSSGVSQFVQRLRERTATTRVFIAHPKL